MKRFLRLFPFSFLRLSFALAGRKMPSPAPPSPPWFQISRPTRIPRPPRAPGSIPCPADKREKSDAYFEGGYWLILWNFLLGSAIAIFLLASRISARMRDFAERRTRFKTLQVAIYAVAYFLLTSLLAFPLFVYEKFFREHAYGLATQTFRHGFVSGSLGWALGLIGS